MNIYPDKKGADSAQRIGTKSVGKTIPHDSAIGHVTGTALYIDDLPRREDELYTGFVGSPIASGTVRSNRSPTCRPP